MARLSQTHKHILVALAQGQRLQDHRDLDGGKVYKLHALDNAPDEVVAGSLVLELQRQQLIQSNMKFPAATYRLTDEGAALAAMLYAHQRRKKLLNEDEGWLTENNYSQFHNN